MGCKALWSPWAAPEKPYDAVDADDVDDDGTDTRSAITNEPMKPVWTDMAISAPIVRNKSTGSLGNIKAVNGYEKLGTSTNTASKTTEKKTVQPENQSASAASGAAKSLLPQSRDVSAIRGSPSGSRGSLAGSRASLTGSRASLVNEKVEVVELVTTV